LSAEPSPVRRVSVQEEKETLTRGARHVTAGADLHAHRGRRARRRARRRQPERGRCGEPQNIAAAKTAGPASGAAGAAETPPGQATPAPEEARDQTPRKADYAGRAKGSRALVAISIRKGRVVAYFCDGRHEAWLKGAAQDERLALTGAKGAELAGSIAEGRATGTVRLPSGEWEFVAPAVVKPSGLYRASALVRGARIRGGWIVLPDGSQVGVLAVNGVPSAAPPLIPGRDVAVGGTPVTTRSADEITEQEWQ
jgi:hypothetical protein